MNPFLRGLMSGDANTNRPILSYFLVGMVDFVCVLMAGERYDKGYIKIGTIWLLAGVIFTLVGWYWPRIARLWTRKSATALPEHRPNVLPTDYGKHVERIAYGLFVRNPGYDALDVHIPKVSIASSPYMLTFPGILPLLCERDHIVFIEAFLADQSGLLPGLDGGRLHDVMCLAEVEQIHFAILYKGTNFREYTTNCVIEIVEWKGNGLTVRAINQE